jgi:hypothetical protein
VTSWETRARINSRTVTRSSRNSRENSFSVLPVAVSSATVITVEGAASFVTSTIADSAAQWNAPRVAESVGTIRSYVLYAIFAAGWPLLCDLRS